MTTEGENELICEKLLGWERITSGEATGFFFPSPSAIACDAPSFTDWASAGLILEALDNEGLAWTFGNGPEGDFECRVSNACDIHIYAETGPLAVRAAALAYLREGK